MSVRPDPELADPNSLRESVPLRCRDNLRGFREAPNGEHGIAFTVTGVFSGDCC